MNDTQDTKTSQLERALSVLAEMSTNITQDDKAFAAKELGMKYRSLAIYWTEGRGKNLDTAVALIKVFKKRIEDREKLIGQ
jgi:hypothetical protein